MVACETLFREFERGLSSRYFRDRVLPEERALLGEMVRGIATVVRDPQSPPRVVRDPADDYLVALARAADVDAIVSADHDLLDPTVSIRQRCPHATRAKHLACSAHKRTGLVELLPVLRVLRLKGVDRPGEQALPIRITESPDLNGGVVIFTTFERDERVRRAARGRQGLPAQEE